jgi:hypothetical protein
MTYGDAKIRDMSRSILPSGARKGARESKAIVRRRSRSNAHRQLRELLFVDYDDYEDPIDDYYGAASTPAGHGWGESNIKSVRQDRRDADRLNHFYRWADAITKKIDEPREKYRHMEKLLPPTLPGRHALTHLEFHFDVEGRYSRSYGTEQYLERRDRFREVFREALTAKIYFDLKKVNAIVREANRERVAAYQRDCRHRIYRLRQANEVGCSPYERMLLTREPTRPKLIPYCKGVSDDEFVEQVVALGPDHRAIRDKLKALCGVDDGGETL